MSKRELCANCGSLLIRKRINYEQRWGERLVAFEDVPVKECPQCGSIWLSSKATESIDKTLTSGEKPEHKLSIPAWSLSRLKAA